MWISTSNPRLLQSGPIATAAIAQPYPNLILTLILQHLLRPNPTLIQPNLI